MKTKNLLLAGLLCLSFLSCQKDTFPPPGSSSMLISLHGRVTDDHGQSVEGALVSLGERQSTTDHNGCFRLQQVETRAERVTLLIDKPGFFQGSRTILPKAGSAISVTFQLTQKEHSGSFSSNTGGAVETEEGLRIEFPAAPLALETGGLYEGQVNVSVGYIDPTSEDRFERMPGMLLGHTLEGESRFLYTYGMVVVELATPAGDPLQLKEGAEALITFPIPPGFQGELPETIPLWHFDEAEGIWQEESSASRQGDSYVGKVGHFSWWSIDGPYPPITLSGSVLLEGSLTPIPDQFMKFSLVGSQNIYYIVTNENGEFESPMPAGVELELRLMNLCADDYYTTTIGPFSDDTALPPILIDSAALGAPIVTLTGTLTDCDGQAVTDGYVWTYTTGYAFTEADGSFEITYLHCPSYPFYLTPVDAANQLQGEPILIDPPISANLGQVAACGYDMSRYLEGEINGIPFYYAEKVHSWLIGGKTSIQYTSDEGSLRLDFSGTGVGTFPATFVKLPGPAWDMATLPDIEVTVYTYGPRGEFVEGSFSGSYQGLDGNTHTISGSFRALRYS